ncbi:MAG: DEAD/DEAH box helicase [Promethearchaeota archaeon]
MHDAQNRIEFDDLIESIIRDKYVIKVLESLIISNNNNSNQKHWKRPSEFINPLIKKFKISEAALYRTLGLLTKIKLVDKVTIHRTDKKYRISRSGLATYFKLFEIKEMKEIPILEAETYLVRKGIYDLTSAQEKFLEFFYDNQDENVLLFASPGTGKTWMTLCYIINGLRCEPDAKCLYLTPFKALNQEKYLDFSRNLKDLSIRCFDSDYPQCPEEEQVVIATYEKAYQAWLTQIPWMEKVRIIIADELTLINEPRRGLTVYLFLNSLIKTKKIQLITSSSLMGDLNPLGDWLHAKLFLYEYNPSVKEFIIYYDFHKKKLVCEHIEGYIHEEIDGLNCRDATIWAVNTIRSKNEDAVIQILNYSIQGCIELCEELMSSYECLPEQEEDLLFLSEFQGYSQDITKLKGFLRKGIAFHHAGLPMKIRNIIEYRLERGMIKILVCTSTLSHGVHYKIDGLIISEYPINYFDKTSYSQFKGRILRPGQDNMQSVFIIPSSLRRAKSLRKIILGSYPSVKEKIEKNVKKLGRAEIVTSILSELKDKRYGVSKRVLNVKVKRKYNSVLLSRIKLGITGVLNELQKDNFIKKTKKKLKLTDEGMNLLKWNFPYESYIYFQNIRNKIKQEKIVTNDVRSEIITSVAKIAKIQLVKWEERRLSQLNTKEIIHVLKLWINEYSYSWIIKKLKENRKENYRNENELFDFSEFLELVPFYDADIDRLSKLVSYIIYQILFLLKEEEKIQERNEIIIELEILNKSVKFGLKSDLALSNLNILDLTRGEKITLRKILCKYPSDLTPNIGMLIERSLYKSSDFYRDLIILFGESRFQELMNHVKEIKTQRKWGDLVREEIIQSRSNKSFTEDIIQL